MSGSVSFKHLAAISPYFNIYQQPVAPASKHVTGAVYLFRHGTIEVSHHDHHAFISPFLKKLEQLQKSDKPFVAGRLAFLSRYQSWITEAHVGLVSEKGLDQTRGLGKAFRTRYKQWLRPNNSKNDLKKPLVKVWADSAERCFRSATAFAEGLSGEIDQDSSSSDDGLAQLDIQTEVLHGKPGSGSCDNLSWHLTFADIDQNAGSDQMLKLMNITTQAARYRLQPDWKDDSPLTVQDVYSMQMLHCYDVVSGRKSPFEKLFDENDWAGFEYLRDVKYHYSEGYGREYPGLYAIPWAVAAVKSLHSLGFPTRRCPLAVAFTHREEVLYLACLLGLACDESQDPDLTKVVESRKWRVSTVAPYLGHIGFETYLNKDGGEKVRIISNGEVIRAFMGKLEQDSDGGYEWAGVDSWIQQRSKEWEWLEGGSLEFLTI